jgi:hypothetical protein
VDVLAGAARALLLQRLSMIVELERHANDVITFALQKCRDDRRVDAARHCRNHARDARRFAESKTVQDVAHGARDLSQRFHQRKSAAGFRQMIGK